MAYKVVHTLIVKKDRAMMLKIDFHKAFDSILWDYLFSIMRCMGFRSLWINNIQECHFTVQVLILVNGSPLDTFQIERGVKQGDPLSLILFILVVEGLNCILDKPLEQGLKYSRGLFVKCYSSLSLL